MFDKVESESEKSNDGDTVERHTNNGKANIHSDVDGYLVEKNLTQPNC